MLSGKVIVVIGGTSGLGLSGAKAIVEAGGRVVAVGQEDEHVEKARVALADRAVVIAAEARHAHTTSAAIERAVERFGACHGLYHVAGGSGRSAGDGALHTISDEGWRATVELNLTSVFLSNRAAAAHFMRAGTGGVVVNVSSVLAFSPSPAHFATHAYAAAKAGIIGLTKTCAAYYAAHNIRFNVIAPGLVETPMSRRAMGDADIHAFVAARQPLDGGRVGRVEDVDAAVVYLLSDGARFVTGQLLAVDGGWSVSDAGRVPVS